MRSCRSGRKEDQGRKEGRKEDQGRKIKEGRSRKELWFFKKSTREMKVNSTDFKSNQLSNRIAGNLTRQIQEYNKNGVDSLSLNSGFVSEELNESFKQLMLSEEVQLYDFDNSTTRAVKISDSSLRIKTSVNDKLINYTIEVEFSNNIIDDVI